MWQTIHTRHQTRTGLLCAYFSPDPAVCRLAVLAVAQKWAFEQDQKYKVGNFVLEEVKVTRYKW